MTKVNQLFEIDNHELFDDKIEVIIINNNIEKTVNVPRVKFENWLKSTDRLEWCDDRCDHMGEHEQEVGAFTIGRYYETGYIKQDLYEFIVLKMMDSGKLLESTFSGVKSFKNIEGAKVKVGQVHHAFDFVMKSFFEPSKNKFRSFQNTEL